MRRAASVARHTADFVITELRSDDDLRRCVRVIRGAFATAAEDLHLTRENAPTHPSFIRLEKVRTSFRSGVAYFGLRLRGRLVGCVAVENAGDCCYIERLSVLPGFRRRGFGLALVEHAIGYARKAGAARRFRGYHRHAAGAERLVCFVGLRSEGIEGVRPPSVHGVHHGEGDVIIGVRNTPRIQGGKS